MTNYPTGHGRGDGPTFAGTFGSHGDGHGRGVARTMTDVGGGPRYYKGYGWGTPACLVLRLPQGSQGASAGSARGEGK